jgi:hypothetical protein
MLTKLELARPHGFWGIGDQASGEVALHAADEVVVGGVAALADGAKGMVFHDGGSADASQQALLHAALELEHSHFWRGLSCQRKKWQKEEEAYDFHLDRDLAKGDPWDEDAGSVSLVLLMLHLPLTRWS